GLGRLLPGRDHLGRMHDLDVGLQAAVLLRLGPDAPFIAHQDEAEVRPLAGRLKGTCDFRGGCCVASHGVYGDAIAHLYAPPPTLAGSTANTENLPRKTFSVPTRVST